MIAKNFRRFKNYRRFKILARSLIYEHSICAFWKMYLILALNDNFLALWSEWTLFGNCSKTCGRGIKTRTRACKQGVTDVAKSNCEGDIDTEDSDCNTENCRKYEVM